MKKILFPTCLVTLSLVSITALWYFGHHRPAMEILKTEPKKVYKETIPITPDSPAVKQPSIETTAHVHEDETGIEPPKATIDVTTDSSVSASTSTLSEGPSGVANENTVSANEHKNEQHSHLHEGDPQAEAKLEAVKAELALAQQHLKETKAEVEPKLISHANRLNAMSPEEQREYWRKFRAFLAKYSPELDLDETIQEFRNGLIKYGYQPRY